MTLKAKTYNYKTLTLTYFPLPCKYPFRGLHSTTEYTAPVKRDDKVITVHQGDTFLFKHSCLPSAKVLIYQIMGLEAEVCAMDEAEPVG